jgi:nucleotide-binding universal stress UspA family protein
MKTILAPTDFSEVSENAVSYAADLAKLAHATLVIFHSYSVPIPTSPEIPVITVPFDEVDKENMKQLKELDKKLKKSHHGLETELITRPGFVVDEILSLQKEKKADLTIMGVTGAGKTAEVLGSNATSVSKKSHSPVIIVPINTKFKKPEKIALACDYKSTVPDKAINQFRQLVKLFNAKVLIFDVLKKTELVTFEKATAEVNLENSLGDIPHSLYFPSGDDLVQETHNFVERNHVDILAVMPHNYSFFGGLFHRSDTKKLALHTNIPLLSIHE